MNKSKIFRLLCSGLVSAMMLQNPLSAFAAETGAADLAQSVIAAEKTAVEEDTEKLYADIPVSSFRVDDISPLISTDLDCVDLFYSQWDDSHYIFLPSTADRKSLTIEYTADDVIYLNDKEVKSGEKTSILSEGDEFTLKVGDTDCGKLHVMQSDLGCIYISTKTGGLDTLDSTYRYLNYSEENGAILMLNAEGNTEYSGEFAKLSSHGNSSWDYSKKKPYNLKLPKKADLYGMGKAKKWILLSNYMDHSMIRNKVTEEMCKSADIDFVGDSVFVDLYADGSYRGTYQLCERVQIQKNRVNITDLEEITEKLNEKDLDEYPRKVVGADSVKDSTANSYKYYDIPNDPDDITGGYLLQFQQWNRYGTKADSGFVTSRGQPIQIDGPEYASKAQVEYIRSFVQDMEDALYSEDGYNSKGKHFTEYIDLDSLIKAYLTEEITMNIDATYSSFYFWKESDTKGDGKLHFGPPWDYDFAYDNFPQSRKNADGNKGYSYKANNLFAAYFPILGYEEGKPVAGYSWLGQIYKNVSYVRRTANAYFKYFEPYLTKLVSGDDPYIMQLAESIRSSAEMSNAEWHTYGGKDYTVFGSSSGKDYIDSVELVRSFIEKRKNWLTELWKPSSYIYGDINEDGEVSVADVVTLQQYLLKGKDEEVKNWTAADLNENYKIDVYDLCLMKRMLYIGEGAENQVCDL